MKLMALHVGPGPSTLAELARRVKADERVWHHALSGFLGTFYTHPERCQAMIDKTPPLLGNPRLDASFGTIAEHLRAGGNWPFQPRRTTRCGS